MQWHKRGQAQECVCVSIQRKMSVRTKGFALRSMGGLAHSALFLTVSVSEPVSSSVESTAFSGESIHV